MRVRNVDDQGVLQFTLIHAVGCVLHRRASRAIRRLQLFRVFVISTSSASVSSLGSGEESEEGKVRENSHIPGGPRRDSLMRARRRARKAPGEPHTDSNGVLSKKISESRLPLATRNGAGLGYKALRYKALLPPSGIRLFRRVRDGPRTVEVKCDDHLTWSSRNFDAEISIMILPQVHLRKPCYDFYFL